jgi:hypothetical protein
MDTKPTEPWEESGRAPMTRKQQNLFNAACEDLEQIRWHGQRFRKADWRHLFSAMVLGERMVPGVNTGNGPPGLVRMARSSTELTKSDATEAIHMAFDVGDHPEDQGLNVPAIRWSATVCKARWLIEDKA